MSYAEGLFLNVFDNAERGEILNTLPVSYDDFAVKSNMYNRAYGVLDGSERGITGPEAQALKTFVLNRCMRRSVWEQLFSATQLTEQVLNFKLSERYITQSIPYIGQAKLQLDYPGVAALEVTRNWYDLSTSVSITSYAAVTTAGIFDDGGVTIVRAPQSLFANPADALVVLQSNRKRITVDSSAPRYAELESGDWLLPLAGNQGVDASSVMDIYHRKVIRVTVTNPDVSAYPAGGSFFPVYPGTEQIIPHTIFNETPTDTTYEFQVGTLVAPAFLDEQVNWERVQTYQLLDSIDIKYRVEEPEYIRLVWSDGEEQVVYQYDPDDANPDQLPRLTAVLVDPQFGIIHLYANNELVHDLNPYYWWACKQSGRNLRQVPETAYVEIKYRVEPNRLPSRYLNAIPRAIEALLAKAAAELPMLNCGCSPDQIGFVAAMQQQMGRNFINPFTGVEAADRDYNKRYGQLMYEYIIYKELASYQRIVRVGKR